MDTKVEAHVATFRVFSSSQRPMSAPSGGHSAAGAPPPPSRDHWMAATTVTEGPLILSRLASNEINYLQVNNFTRAIMPRSKIWRVSRTELVIPASHTNYWLITLHGSELLIAQLDQILRGLCKYEVSSVDNEDIQFDLDEELLNTSYKEFLQNAELNAGIGARKRSDVVFGPLLYSYEEGLRKNSERDSLTKTAKRTISQGNAKTILSETIENDPPVRKPALSPEHKLEIRPRSPSQSAPTQSASVLDSPDTSRESDDIAIKPSYGLSPSPPITSLDTPPTSPEQNATLPIISRPSKSTPLRDHLTEPRIRDAPIETLWETNSEISTRPEAEKPVEEPVLELITLQEQPLQQPIAKTESRPPSKERIEAIKELERELNKPSELVAKVSREPRFEPRFSHPLIPSSHVSRYYPTNPGTSPILRPRVSLQRRDLTSIGPSTLHQDVTTVGGYIGLKAVKGLLRRT